MDIKHSSYSLNCIWRQKRQWPHCLICRSYPMRTESCVVKGDRLNNPWSARLPCEPSEGHCDNLATCYTNEMPFERLDRDRNRRLTSTTLSVHVVARHSSILTHSQWELSEIERGDWRGKQASSQVFQTRYPAARSWLRCWHLWCYAS